jgi:hypothetical protein
MNRKNKNFIEKQIKNLSIVKKNKFKLDQELEIIQIFDILINSSILVFFQFLSLDSAKDRKLFTILLDKRLSYIYLKKKLIKKFFFYKIVSYLNNFNNILSLNDLNDLKTLKIKLKEQGAVISGYYFNNIFFFKKDLNLNNIKKKDIVFKFIKFKHLIKKIFIKCFLLLRYSLKQNLWQQ